MGDEGNRGCASGHGADLAGTPSIMYGLNARSAFVYYDLENIRYGVGQARRGWLEKDDVLNMRSLAAVRPLLRRSMRAA
jgi:hypothetical protein